MNAGILFISFKRPWKILNLLALIITWSIFNGWLLFKYHNEDKFFAKSIFSQLRKLVGFTNSVGALECRLDLKNPPTPVGGFRIFSMRERGLPVSQERLADFIGAALPGNDDLTVELLGRHRAGTHLAAQKSRRVPL